MNYAAVNLRSTYCTIAR